MRTTLIAACGGVGNIGFRGEAGSRQTVSFEGFGPRFWLKPLILLRLKIFHNIPYANRTYNVPRPRRTSSIRTRRCLGRSPGPRWLNSAGSMPFSFRPRDDFLRTVGRSARQRSNTELSICPVDARRRDLRSLLQRQADGPIEGAANEAVEAPRKLAARIRDGPARPVRRRLRTWSRKGIRSSPSEEWAVGEAPQGLPGSPSPAPPGFRGVRKSGTGHGV